MTNNEKELRFLVDKLEWLKRYYELLTKEEKEVLNDCVVTINDETLTILNGIITDCFERYGKITKDVARFLPL